MKEFGNKVYGGMKGFQKNMKIVKDYMNSIGKMDMQALHKMGGNFYFIFRYE